VVHADHQEVQRRAILLLAAEQLLLYAVLSPVAPVRLVDSVAVELVVGVIEVLRAAAAVTAAAVRVVTMVPVVAADPLIRERTKIIFRVFVQETDK
jgi:hypothetical protein